MSGLHALPARAPRSSIVLERIMASDMRPLTKPTILMYRQSHLAASKEATRFSKARVSLHAIPSTE